MTPREAVRRLQTLAPVLATPMARPRSVIAWIRDQHGARLRRARRVAARSTRAPKKFLTKDCVLCLTSQSSHP
jgi:hypothetical protein